MPAKPKPRIKQIRLKIIQDPDPDLSFYGEYTNKPSSHAVDLERSGLWRGPSYYKYFEPAGWDKGNTEAENRRYAAQDLARMEEYEKQYWQSVGICAIAEVEVPLGSRVLSDEVEDCLFGIETDSGGAYLTETTKDLLSEVKDKLREMGFTDKQIESAPFDGNTELFDYGDTDVPTPKEHTLSVVFVSDPPEEEPEEITVQARQKGFKTPSERGQHGTQATFVFRRPQRRVRTYRRRP